MSYRDNGGTEDGDSEHGGVERQGREGAGQQRPPHTPVITNLPTGGCPSSCVHIHRIIIIIITIIVETKLAEDLVSTVGDDLDDLIIEVNTKLCLNKLNNLLQRRTNLRKQLR